MGDLKQENHWAGVEEPGSVMGMRIMLYAYRLGGKYLFKLVLFPVIVFFYLQKSALRKSTTDYLMRANEFYGDTVPSATAMNVFRIFWGFGESLIDKLGVWMGKLTIDDVDIHNGELIEEVLASGEGAMMFVSHLGNFEVCQCLSGRHKNISLTVLHHTRNAQKFNKVLSQFNAQSHVDSVQITRADVGLAMRLSEKISDGGLIAIAADRISVNHPDASLNLPFMGSPAPFPEGPFTLCNALGCPALFVSCIKKRGKYHIYFETLRKAGSVPRSERKEAIESLAKRYVAFLEKYAIQAPLQWYNFYSFWGSKINHETCDN